MGVRAARAEGKSESVGGRGDRRSEVARAIAGVGRRPTPIGVVRVESIAMESGD
jgi:hypothetical protein